MFKKILSFLILLTLLFFWANPLRAQEPKATLYLFWSRSCPHCAREKVFLEKLVAEYPELEVKDFEISASQKNQELFKKVGEEFGAPGYVPFTVVGKYHFVGFLDEKTTGEEIKNAVEVLERLGPGTWQFVDHPGMDTPEMRLVWHIGDEDVAISRDAVTKAFTSSKVKEVISRRRIKLIGYNDLKLWH